MLAGVGLPAALNCEFLNTPAKGNPMNEPQKLDDFTVELATRIALHEVLLEKAFAQLLRGNPNALAQWDAVGDQLVHVMATLPGDEEGMDDYQVRFLHAQRERGQELAKNFVKKVARYLPAKG
jgi:hypothetical protein